MVHQTDPTNISCAFSVLPGTSGHNPATPSLPLMCGNQGGVFAFQIKDLPFFSLSDFRDVLRLAVLSWFTAQFIKCRKRVSSTNAFGIFLLLYSSFKLSSHDLASRTYRFILGLGLIVNKNQYRKSF